MLVKKIRTCIFFIAWGGLCVSLMGCSSIINAHTQKESMMKAYVSNDRKTVEDRIQWKLKSTSGTGDYLMWTLEAGSYYFSAQNYDSAILYFRSAESQFEAYDDRAKVSVQDASAEIGMALTNLNALPYRGWCRDRIALSIFKSLAYLGQGKEESFRAQLHRLRDVQKKVIEDHDAYMLNEQQNLDSYAQSNVNTTQMTTLQSQMLDSRRNQSIEKAWEETRVVAHRGYGNFLNPMAIFLSGLGFIRDGNYENAHIDFARLYELMPDNPLVQKYYATVLAATNRPIPRDLATPFNFPIDRKCVYVIFANGRGPAFKSVNVYFPVMVAWPVCEYYASPFNGVRVEGGNVATQTVTIADMDGILAQEYNERLPAMITRIVISTLIKEGASYGATIALGREDPLLGLAVFLASAAYRAAVNTADTRTWEMLPKTFEVTQLPMPENRVLTLSVSLKNSRNSAFKMDPLKIHLPEDAPSVILYIHAMSPQNFSYHVFPLMSQ